MPGGAAFRVIFILHLLLCIEHWIAEERVRIARSRGGKRIINGQEINIAGREAAMIAQ
jgi:hypothetical protein